MASPPATADTRPGEPLCSGLPGNTAVINQSYEDDEPEENESELTIILHY